MRKEREMWAAASAELEEEAKVKFISGMRIAWASQAQVEWATQQVVSFYV